MSIQASSAKAYAYKGGLAGALLLCAAVWGCASPSTSQSTALPAQVQAPAAPPAYIHTETMNARVSKPTDGSLWDEKSGLGEMFANVKARRIGDLITIRIVESSQATNSASTTTDRDSSLTAGINNFFNAEKRFPADQPFFNPFSSVSGSITNQFSGNGATQRSGDLNAYMTARVVDIMDNGNLVIQGNREVRVNAENLMITLTGIVRPRDVSADNVIQSTYVADARITYSGSGVINDKQKPGWLTRIFDKVWPF